MLARGSLEASVELALGAAWASRLHLASAKRLATVVAVFMPVFSLTPWESRINGAAKCLRSGTFRLTAPMTLLMMIANAEKQQSKQGKSAKSHHPSILAAPRARPPGRVHPKGTPPTRIFHT
jgi:hypothetical protein